MTRNEKIEVIKTIEQKMLRDSRRQLYTLYPDTGPLRRELYPRHLMFFKAGAKYRERCALSANRIGKSFGMGGYETVLHLTGLYPDWWEGRRFSEAVDWWVAGKTNETTRDIIQTILFGPVKREQNGTKYFLGTGLVPHKLIKNITWKQGVNDLADTVEVEHVTGERSICGLKSYQQGRGAFEGTAKHGIWADEEVPIEIYGECIIRTATTKGLFMLTFTPLEGISEVVRSFMPGAGNSDITEVVTSDAGMVEITPSKATIMAGWDHVPHLDEQTKRELLSSTPPHLRDARSKGIPSLGSGAIYPLPEEDIKCKPFRIPAWWPRCYAMDVGWNRTAAIWGAIDKENDVTYLYSEYYRGQAEPVIHAQGIKARGDWIPGVIDPASRGRAQKDGAVLYDMYEDLGLHITPSKNAVEAGIQMVWEMLSTGRLVVFDTLQNFLSEIRLYRRDENGKIIKEYDHLLDCLHPDTMVITDRGKRKISSLVGCSGKVLTVCDTFVRFKHCRKTRVNQKIYKLCFSDGSIVRCTGDHKFLTPSGWVKAIDMPGHSAFKSNGGIECKSQKELRQPGKISAGLNTTCVESIINRTEKDYIGKSLNQNMATFLKVFVSTIKTLIAQTIVAPTLNLCHRQHTCLCMPLEGQRASDCQTTLYRQQLSGTGLKRVKIGTKNTMKISSICSIKKLSIRVKSVVRNILQINVKGTGFARITVKQSQEQDQVLTTKKENACGVESVTQLINTPSLLTAQGHAVVNLVSLNVEDCVSDVYCMEVEHGHAFAVEGGIIVHNCVRYLCLSGLEEAITKPAQRQISRGNVAVYDTVVGY